MQRPVFDPRENSIHLLRLILAALVVWTHAFTLTGYATPLNALTGGQLNEGALAVDSFLVLSGFLICYSAQRRNVLTFLRSRFLRIFPGLICAVLFTAFIAGGLAFEGTYAQYVHLQKGPGHYALHWATLNVLDEPWGIAGVFATNPTSSLNVSLWTVKFEVALYLLTAVLMLLRWQRKKGVCIGCLVCFTVLFVLYEGLNVQLWSIPKVQAWVLNHWNYERFVRTGLFFFIGMTLCHFQSYLPRTWWFAALCTAALVGSCFIGLLPWAHVLITPYLLIRICSLRTFRRVSRLGDWSFGLYLYHYPMMQLILHIWPQVTPPMLFLAGLTATLPIAALSWRLVEAPALKLKSKL